MLRTQEDAKKRAFDLYLRIPTIPNPKLSWEEFASLIRRVRLNENAESGQAWAVSLEPSTHVLPRLIETRALDGVVWRIDFADDFQIPLEERRISEADWARLSDVDRRAIASTYSTTSESDARRISMDLIQTLFPDFARRNFECVRFGLSVYGYTTHVGYSGYWEERPRKDLGEAFAYPNYVRIELDPSTGRPTRIAADYRNKMVLTQTARISADEALQLAWREIQPRLDKGEIRLMEPPRQSVAWGTDHGQAVFSYVIDFPLEQLIGPRIGSLVRVSVDPYSGALQVH